MRESGGLWSADARRPALVVAEERGSLEPARRRVAAKFKLFWECPPSTVPFPR